MRPSVGLGLVCVTAVAAASLSAASAVGGASDGLSDTSLIKSANFAGAFGGGIASDRVSDDPDAPIRTSRFDPPAATVELAGAAPSPPEAVQLAAAERAVPVPASTPLPDARPQAAAVTLARVAAAPAPSPIVRRPAAYARGAAFQPQATPRTPFSSGRRLALSLTTGETPLSPGSGLAFAARNDRDNPIALAVPRKSKLFDARRLGLQVDLSPEKSRKGRWFVFAATSGDALGFNLFGDPAKSGRKRTGWSVEKLAEYGKVQLGLGWRKGPMQVSAAATQREIGAYGYSRDDTVFGLSFTISGGNRLPAPKARRGMPRD
jgi:hypothetical protein